VFLTETELINRKLTAESRMNESDIIKYIVNQDINSPQKRKMAEGERYYCGEHDILKKDFTSAKVSENYEDAEGAERERVESFRNPNRSNHHNVNAFHKVLVDQKTAYMVSREPSIIVKGAEENKELKAYEDILTEFADDTFNETIQDLVTGASNKGFEALQVYYDENGTLQYRIVPAEEIIPIYDTRYEKELVEVIRYYTITVVENGQEYFRKKVEWWTKKDVTYYTEKEKDMYVKDTNIPCNPAPHWWDITTLNKMEKRRVPNSWGKVPFIILKNNRNATTDLENIKGLIDAYDLLSSEGTNNLLDLVDLYWVIAGYGGEAAGAIAKKLQINKAVHINDSQGKVEAKQVDLPVAGRLEYLKMLRRDIFHFGMGVDTDPERFGTAPSGVSLKFQYTLLDLKAGNMIAKLKKAIKELLWYVTEDYNRKNGTNYDISLITVSINTNRITNDAETVTMIQASKGIVSDKTLLARHPFVDDVNAELDELEAQKEQELKTYTEYKGLGDGVEE
jgi:SPP1 family phage portal protein